MPDFVSVSCKKGSNCLQASKTDQCAGLWSPPEPGGCAGHFSQTAEKMVGQRAPQAGMCATPGALAWCQAQLWDNVDASRRAGDAQGIFRT